MCVIESEFHKVVGKYCLESVGFMLKKIILTPYRGVKYYLKEFIRRRPHARELFNHHRSSLRNVIGRTFVVLKKKILHHWSWH